MTDDSVLESLETKNLDSGVIVSVTELRVVVSVVFTVTTSVTLAISER